MSNSIAPGSLADVNVRVTALTTNPNVPVTYKTIVLKKNLVNGVNTLTQEMMSNENIKYVIKYDYALREDVIIPANCVLEFDGGSLNNGTIIGTNTKLQGSISFGANIIIDGTFIKDNIIDISIFKGVYSDDAILFKNASLIGENIKLEDNKHYRIEKRDLSIYADSIFAETNAYLDFINIGETTDGQHAVHGLNVIPNKNLVLFKNLTISEDYPRESTVITTGNTLSASKNVEIDGCKFLGTSQSSFFASSNTYSFYAHDCIATSIKGDHLFYCSMVCKSFTLKNIYVSGTEELPSTTLSLFKVRKCNEVVFNVENVKTDNTTGYIYMVDERSKGSLNLNNITHNVPENQSVSETDLFIYASIESKFFINIINSNIDCGSTNDHPLIIYRDGENDAIIEINNSNITTSCVATGGTITMKNSYVELKGKRQIIVSDYIGYYENSIVNSQFADSSSVFYFYKNNYNLTIKDCTFNNSSIYFIYATKKDVEDNVINSIILINSSVRGARGLMNANAQKYNLVKNNSIIIHNSGYTDEGDTKPINLSVGTTTDRPTLIDIGFRYFDITIGKPIYWNGTDWIDATGATV